MRAGINILKNGTRVVLTKKEIKPGCDSAFKTGRVRSGTLCGDADWQQPLRFFEWDGEHVTSPIQSVTQDNNDIIVETKTSFYIVRIVTNEDDDEFKENLRH